jgi:predicted RNA-binding protein with PIN domain
MHYLIDGHNLIARLDDLSLDDPDDEAKLVLRLRSWTATSKKRRVTAVFDGGLPGGKSTRLSTSRVTVVFATSGQTADDLLIRRINQIKNPTEYTLVSSDYEVLAAARRRRMPVILSEEFATQLPAERPRQATSQVAAETRIANERESPQLSEDEVNEWLELFGPVVERKAPPPPPPIPIETKDSEPSSPPAKPSIGRVDRERSLSNEEVEEWLRLFGQR